jgi:hypothetical protein
MTAVGRGRPVRGRKRHIRRDEIFEGVCRYADEMDGPTPSISADGSAQADFWTPRDSADQKPD